MSTIRILVVEDSSSRGVVSSLPQSRKESHLQIISEVSDGLEAILKAKELKPDLILLDIGLPKLNGVDAAFDIYAALPRRPKYCS